MSEQKQTQLSQSVVWAAIAAVALVGIGLIVLALKDVIWDGGSPTPTVEADTIAPSPTPIVTFLGIKQIAELATVESLAVVEVQNEKIPDDIRNWVGAKEEILMLVYGTVKAGFDLSKLSENDLKADGTQVQLILPAPEILSINIDNERTHVVLYNKSPFLSHDENLESQTRQIADEAIKESAIKEGKVLELAAEYGQLYFENYLRSLGFTDVRVIVKQQGL